MEKKRERKRRSGEESFGGREKKGGKRWEKRVRGRMGGEDRNEERKMELGSRDAREGERGIKSGGEEEF